MSTYASFVTEPFPTQVKEWRRVRVVLRRWGARRVVAADKGSAYAGVFRDLSDDGVWDQFERMCGELPPVLPVPLSIAFLAEGTDYETRVERVLTCAMLKAEAEERAQQTEEQARMQVVIDQEERHARSRRAIRDHYHDKRQWARDPTPPKEPTVNASLERFLDNK